MQNLQGIRWSKIEVEKKLKKIISEAFENVYQEASKRKTSYRKASYLLAVKRLVDAMILRGMGY